jgi:2-oxoglutarate ferredoxin oxidoreductase subunit gamma
MKAIMEERILIAGAGGQGALTIGKFLATVAMEKHHVTFFPSYGAEVRGGTAHCHVVISEDEIATPVVDEATVLMVMNQMSYGRFLPNLRRDGLLLVNSSMIRQEPPAECRKIVAVPASELAGEMGDIRVANVILLGVMNTVHPILDEEAVRLTMDHILGGDPSKSRLLDLNKQAYKVGAEQGRKFL